MPSYEATSDTQYAKIVDFLKSQPADSIWNQCFQGVIRERTVEWIKFWKEQKPEWHLFYVEDKKKQIQALGCLEERGMNPLEPKMVINVYVFMNEPNVVAKNYLFNNELLLFMAKWCIERGYYVAEVMFRDIDLPFHPVPDSTVSYRESGERFGHKTYIYTIDISKFATV